MFATVNSNVKHRAVPDKLNKPIYKSFAENMSFRVVVAISEALDQPT